MTSTRRAAMMLKQAAENIAASAIRFRTSDGWPPGFWPIDLWPIDLWPIDLWTARFVIVRCRYALTRSSHSATAVAQQQAPVAPELAAPPPSRCGFRLPVRAADSSTAVAKATKAPRLACPTNSDCAAPGLECAWVR